MSSFIHPDFKDSNKNSIYSLYGVIHHNGGLNYGHYHAEVKNILGDKKWYYWSDLSTNKMYSPKFCGESLSILFYCRNDIELSPSY